MINFPDSLNLRAEEDVLTFPLICYILSVGR